MDSQQEEILFISFNQDASCFIVGCDSGFRIFNTHPLKHTYRRDFNGGVGIAQLLYRTNILALAGGGKNPCSPPNKILIWDDRQMRPTGEVTLRFEVRGLCIRREYLVIVAESKVYVYGLNNLKLIQAIPTSSNTRGICAVSCDPHPLVIACPEKQRGCVLIKMNNFESSKVIKAHKSSISCIKFNTSASLMATASDKGTIIRVYSVESGNALHEMRRGIDRAEIYCICFNSTSEWLAITSDKGTLHVFSVGSNKQRNVSNSKRVVSRFFGKYRNKQKSFAHLKINDARTLCTFIENENLMVVLNGDGKYYLLSFDPEREDSCSVQFQSDIYHMALD